MVEKVAVMLPAVGRRPADRRAVGLRAKLDGFRCLLSISEFGDVRLPG